MYTRPALLRPSAIALAIACLAATPLAHAGDDDDAKAYTQPTNTVEIGVINVSKSSAKFGEYSGLNKSGVDANLSFSLRGGDGYSRNDAGGDTRWLLQGSDLGLSSRALSGKLDKAGAWSLGFNYDELQHNISDTYQTPYVGSNGGNQFTLPSGFGIATTSGAGTTALTAGQLAAYHQLNISSSRKNLGLQALLPLSERFSLSFDVNHLEQSGAKLQAFGQSDTFATGTTKPLGEGVVVLPMATNYKTLSATLALNWTGSQGYASAAYYLSLMTDGYSGVGFTPSMAATATGIDQSTQTMTSAPSNELHQLTLSGGWRFTPTTKLAGSLSTSRNTQNMAYVDPGLQGSATGGLMKAAMPATSLNGKVVNTHADLKLTDQSVKNLSLAAGIKLDDRDNQTPSLIYSFDAIGSGHAAAYPNTPLSVRKQAADASADYRIKAGHVLRLALAHEDTSRHCSNYGVNAKYPAGTNCVVATDSSEDKVDLGYRLRVSEAVDFKLGYGWADRKTTSDPKAIAAFIGTNGFIPPAVAAATPPGQNAGDFLGFYPYFDASRTQQVLKGSMNWQASDALAANFSAKATDDSYGSDYGVKKGKSWSANVDASYAYSKKGSAFVYATQQYRQRELTDIYRNSTASAASATALNIPAFATWTNTLKDEDLTLGAGIKQSGLLGGKLDLSADASYSLGQATYGTVLNYTAATTGGITCNSSNANGVVIGSCGTLPAIRSESARIKLAGVYTLDKASKVRLDLLFQKLGGADYYYNGYQQGSNPNSLLATNQQYPRYMVNAIGVSYLYSFQ